MPNIKFEALGQSLITLKWFLEVRRLPDLKSSCELLLYTLLQDVKLVLIKQLVYLLSSDLIVYSCSHQCTFDHLYHHVLLRFP